MKKTCKVCGAENVHGNHFDVECCRACAIFFRRRAGTKYSNLKCQSVHCDGKVFFCKPCRLKRCYDVGMNTSKFQHGRDTLTMHYRKKLPESMSTYLGRPQLILFASNPPESLKKTFVDVTYLIAEASKILSDGPPTPIFLQNKSQLEKLSIALKMSTSNFKNAQLYEKLTQNEMSRFWEYYMLRVAKWLVHFDEFQRIPHEMKLQLLQTFWHVFARLDKLAATATSRHLKICESDRMWAMSNGRILDMDRTKVDFSWISNYSNEQIFYFLNSIATLDLTEHIETIRNLELSEVELNYMLAQLAFNYAGKRLQGDFVKVCDRFEHILADNLHDYYVNQLKMPRYFGRLTQIMKINNAIQKDIFMNRPRCELAALFNVFNVEFSHPDMFFDTGFGGSY